ncbi:MAG: hypothetical protein U1E11_00865, partial [Dethiobacteria bacterium]|nr:hypothetical protein [Dethiobacteria bacterium]
GRIIMQGLRTYNTGMLLAGILMVVITTVLLERMIGQVDHRILKRFSLGELVRLSLKKAAQWVIIFAAWLSL